MMLFASSNEEIDRFLKKVSITVNQEVDFPTYIKPVDFLGFKVCKVVCSETGKNLFSVHEIEGNIFIYCRFPIIWYQPGYGTQGLTVPLLAGPFPQDISPTP